MTHRLAAVLACLTSLTLGACASAAPTGSELVAERLGDATLIRFDEASAAPWRERALSVIGTASIEDLLYAQGCTPMAPADVATASPDGDHFVFVEHTFDCGATTPSVVTVFEAGLGDLDDASWLSSERFEVGPFGGSVERVAVMGDGIVAERTPGYGQQTREISRVVGHGETIADTCDQALLASAYLAMQDAIEQCGPDAYERLIQGEAIHAVQLLPDGCRATTEQPYACHEVTIGDAP